MAVPASPLKFLHYMKPLMTELLYLSNSFMTSGSARRSLCAYPAHAWWICLMRNLTQVTICRVVMSPEIQQQLPLQGYTAYPTPSRIKRSHSKRSPWFFCHEGCQGEKSIIHLGTEWVRDLMLPQLVNGSTNITNACSIKTTIFEESIFNKVSTTLFSRYW